MKTVYLAGRSVTLRTIQQICVDRTKELIESQKESAIKVEKDGSESETAESLNRVPLWTELSQSLDGGKT